MLRDRTLIGRPQRATIRSISSATGLSLSTVSRALNRDPTVRAETASLVASAAERLGYRRSAAAANLRSGRSEILSLLMPVEHPGDMLGDLGALQLLAGAHARLADSACTLNLVPYEFGADPVSAVERVIRQGVSDGVILTLTQPEDERIKLLASRDVPFATFGRTELALPHASYDVDNVDFGRRATLLLLDRGCRRPILINPPARLMYSWHREVGFRRALAERGVAFDPGLIVAQGDHAAVLRLAATPAEADGFVCESEISALRVMRALEATGRRVGRDAHVTTLETSALPTLFTPPIPGFFQDLNRAGWVAADLLLKRMAGEDPRDLRVLDTVTLRDRGAEASAPRDAWPGRHMALEPPG